MCEKKIVDVMVGREHTRIKSSVGDKDCTSPCASDTLHELLLPIASVATEYNPPSSQELPDIFLGHRRSCRPRCSAQL
ncbi:hypothetical protein NY2A_b709L [Paramecium bursaria Chlorella virus NY2A]|uniref:Uncharacterized protein b709L n=1 Tax=Paramecium bursaria Chlorella virus NY2A TaxID=46021 RepID=A7IXN4_PBCVN|nr:hypothetical protein NY2A_b709L [Paramecium bursaria Chlorella virus NY2A]ABT15108.1 hypothetical protein NY2A_b709L [Paramecium bursaria Chlorella virus NY2A]